MQRLRFYKYSASAFTALVCSFWAAWYAEVYTHYEAAGLVRWFLALAGVMFCAFVLFAVCAAALMLTPPEPPRDKLLERLDSIDRKLEPGAKVLRPDPIELDDFAIRARARPIERAEPEGDVDEHF